MLVSVGLDTAGAIQLADSDTPVGRAATRRLIDVLLQHCVLCATRGEIEDLADGLRSVPQSVRKLWTTALSEALIRVLPSSILALSDVRTVEELTEHWRGLARIVYLALDKATAIGLALDEASFVDMLSDVEVARVDLPEEASRLREVVLQSREDIPRNTRRDVVWTERFALLASISPTVTIVDRYAIKNVLDGRSAGLRWFLGKLDESGVNERTSDLARECVASCTRRHDVAAYPGGPAGRKPDVPDVDVGDRTRVPCRRKFPNFPFRRAPNFPYPGLTMFNTPRCRQSTPRASIGG